MKVLGIVAISLTIATSALAQWDGYYDGRDYSGQIHRPANPYLQRFRGYLGGSNGHPTHGPYYNAECIRRYPQVDRNGNATGGYHYYDICLRGYR